uniref:Uncharacterized protein n=1 Tax=Mycena chlorophos TaxID=658473 RepID=A0ABQ0LCT4_MYCCL|nr:predicted protein [Mycena chlorophos]
MLGASLYPVLAIWAARHTATTAYFGAVIFHNLDLLTLPTHADLLQQARRALPAVATYSQTHAYLAARKFAPGLVDGPRARVGNVDLVARVIRRSMPTLRVSRRTLPQKSNISHGSGIAFANATVGLHTLKTAPRAIILPLAPTLDGPRIGSLDEIKNTTSFALGKLVVAVLFMAIVFAAQHWWQQLRSNDKNSVVWEPSLKSAKLPPSRRHHRRRVSIARTFMPAAIPRWLVVTPQAAIGTGIRTFNNQRDESIWRSFNTNLEIIRRSEPMSLPERFELDFLAGLTASEATHAETMWMQWVACQLQLGNGGIVNSTERKALLATARQGFV